MVSHTKHEQTHDEKRLPKPGSPGRYIFAVRPKCGECGSLKIFKYGTIDAESAYVRCGDCGAKFILIAE